MSKSNSGKSGGVSFSGALSLLFIGLKLGKVINCPGFWCFGHYGFGSYFF